MSTALATALVASLALLLAGGLILWSFIGEVGRARAAAESVGRIALTSAGTIEYAEHGAGTALLSIHGAGGGYDQGLTNARELVGEGYRIIAPSRFGYLGTPIPADASVIAQAAAHAALLDYLLIDKVVVVGISAGARSASELALRHPEKVSALIMIVPGTYAPAADPVAIEASRGSRLAFLLVNAGADFAWWAMEKLAPTVLIRFLGVPPEVIAAAPGAEQERIRRIVRSVQPLSRRFRGINIDSNPDLARPPFEEIGVPTLVISARDDLFNTLPAAEVAAAAIPGARLVIFDTGGHLLVGHDGEVPAIVDDFLEQARIPPWRA